MSLQDPMAVDAFPIQESKPLCPALAYIDVYVDNFIKLAQGWLNAMTVQRYTYHSIDKVFCLNDSLNEIRKEPILVKKLLKSNGHWSTLKTILGWDIDNHAMIILLPPH